MGTGLKPFGAGWFGVRALHREREGEYALFMPMTTEQATIGGRETFGEPKKIGDVVIQIDGERVAAWFERMGFRMAELSGTLGEELPTYERDKVDFSFKFNPRPTATASTTTPPSCTATAATRHATGGRSTPS